MIAATQHRAHPLDLIQYFTQLVSKLLYLPKTCLTRVNFRTIFTILRSIMQ
eukprot:c44381_g1_i1 orf=2-151(-)